MSEQLITVGEATQRLGVTSDLPSNKCLTKGEFDELVAQIPELASNGVYIMHKNRFLVKREKWSFSNDEASGVAVKTDNCAFVIAKEEQSYITWGGYSTLINGCVTITVKNTAKTDYKGKENTDAIVSQLGTGSEYAARYCKEYTFPHGVKGYLPALGELWEALQNKSEVDACMSKIGGKAFYDELIGNYRKWSSTQYNNNNAWYLDWYEEDISYESKDYYQVNDDHFARAFAPFK